MGRLWTSLADYFIRRGLFEKARDVYEEGLTSVVTVRDFSLVFDALTQFEESLVAAKMEQVGWGWGVSRGGLELSKGRVLTLVGSSQSLAAAKVGQELGSGGG